MGAGTLLLAAVLSLIVVDLLRTISAIARAQAAADAAALSAAQEIAIPSGDRSPAQVAALYARRNAATLLECRCDPFTSEAVVSVAMAVDLLFVGDDRSVTARARAVVGDGSGT